MSAPRRLATIAVGILAASLTALPAAADPAGPTHYQSTITQIETADGVPVPIEVEVLGGDAFLSVSAEAGTRVDVPGYDGEPYLRIAPDGTVSVNERSPARWINDARYGAAEAGVAIPAIADSEAPPSWTEVADGGAYAWHDHRIHFMSPSLPDAVDPSEGDVQAVFDWSVPLRVDDRDVTVTGELLWIPGPAPVIPLALVGVALLLTSVLFLRRASAVAPGVLTTAVITVAAGSSGVVGFPPGTEGQPALIVLPLIAAALVLIGLLWRGRQGSSRDWLIAAAGVPVLTWGVLQSGTLMRPIVPGWLSIGWVRGATVIALGVGGAAVIVLLRRVVEATRLDVAADRG